MDLAEAVPQPVGGMRVHAPRVVADRGPGPVDPVAPGGIADDMPRPLVGGGFAQ